MTNQPLIAPHQPQLTPLIATPCVAILATLLSCTIQDTQPNASRQSVLQHIEAQRYRNAMDEALSITQSRHSSEEVIKDASILYDFSMSMVLSQSNSIDELSTVSKASISYGTGNGLAYIAAIRRSHELTQNYILMGNFKDTIDTLKFIDTLTIQDNKHHPVWLRYSVNSLQNLMIQCGAQYDSECLSRTIGAVNGLEQLQFASIAGDDWASTIHHHAAARTSSPNANSKLTISCEKLEEYMYTQSELQTWMYHPPTARHAMDICDAMKKGQNDRLTDRSKRPSLLCNDGTYSPTCTCGASRRGCCSHHGGVSDQSCRP